MVRDYELLIFDWDGTLIDSIGRIVACLQGAIELAGVETRDEAALRNIIGLGLREAVEALYPGHDDFLRDELAGHYRTLFLGDHLPQAGFFPGARETLTRLRENDFRIAIATGKARRGLDRAICDLGLEGVFDATRCADETRSKPHPQMLHELMAELNVAPDRTLMVGDTEYDLEMAANSSVTGIGVSYGAHAVSRLLRHDPAHVIDSIPELLEWLGDGSVTDQ